MVNPLAYVQYIVHKKGEKYNYHRLIYTKYECMAIEL